MEKRFRNKIIIIIIIIKYSDCGFDSPNFIHVTTVSRTSILIFPSFSKHRAD